MENNGDFFLRLPRPFEILLAAFQKVRRRLGKPVQSDPSAVPWTCGVSGG
jgi:hypothetical protein